MFDFPFGLFFFLFSVFAAFILLFGVTNFYDVTKTMNVVEDRSVDDAHGRFLMLVLIHVQYLLELVDHLGSWKFAFDLHDHCGWLFAADDEKCFDHHHYVTIPIDLHPQHGRGWVVLKMFKSNFFSV